MTARVGQPDGLADALSALDEDVAASISRYTLSGRVLAIAGCDVGEELETAKLWVALNARSEPGAAVRNILPAFWYAHWANSTLGDLSPSILTPRNVDHWVAYEVKNKSPEWRGKARPVLRQIGRTVNPAAWTSSEKISARPPAPAYSSGEEAAFRLEVVLPGRRNPQGPMWMLCATCGIGMDGREAATVRPADLIELGDNRLAVAVTGRNPRTVPIRREYADLARRAAELIEPDQRFIAGLGHGAPYTTAARIEVTGLGKLSLNRARSTWLTAHILAGTPLPALRIIAGPVSPDTLNGLIDAVSVAMDPSEAVREGLRA